MASSDYPTDSEIRRWSYPEFIRQISLYTEELLFVREHDFSRKRETALCNFPDILNFYKDQHSGAAVSPPGRPASPVSAAFEEVKSRPVRRLKDVNCGYTRIYETHCTEEI